MNSQGIKILHSNNGVVHKIVISSHLENKIRTFCALSPQREWSGVLFYKFEGDFEKGVTILANDMYLMDQGTHTHTEFDLTSPEITKYMVYEEITDHCIGLIHSHCSFNAFFSGEDSMTLEEYGKEMNNFVSLVVNNEGKYVARVTKKFSFEGKRTISLTGVISSELFNSEVVEKKEVHKSTEDPAKDMWVEYAELEVEKPDLFYSNDILERFGEVNHKCSIEKTTSLPSTAPKFKDFGNFNTVNSKDLPKYEQGTLFPKYENKSTPIVTDEEEYQKWFNKLINGSPIDSSTPNLSKLEKLYKEEFPYQKDFDDWFNLWFYDYMMLQFDETWLAEPWDDELPEEAICAKVSEDLRKLNCDFASNMAEIIDNNI